LRPETEQSEGENNGKEQIHRSGSDMIVPQTNITEK